MIRNDENNAILIRHEDNLKPIPTPQLQTRNTSQPGHSHVQWWLDETKPPSTTPAYDSVKIAPSSTCQAPNPPRSPSLPCSPPSNTTLLSSATSSTSTSSSLDQYRPRPEAVKLLDDIVNKLHGRICNHDNESIILRRSNRTSRPPNLYGFGVMVTM